MVQDPGGWERLLAVTSASDRGSEQGQGRLRCDFHGGNLFQLLQPFLFF